MSRTARDATRGEADNAQLPFEDALKRLESIVESMETEDLPLEGLLSKYEQGTKLAQHCQTRLAEAELKIQQLERTPAGELTLKHIPAAPPGVEE